jgi:hypothetical protein
MKWALPVRERSLKSTGPHKRLEGEEGYTSVHVHTGLRLLSSTRRWVHAGDLAFSCCFYTREVQEFKHVFCHPRVDWVHAGRFDIVESLLHTGNFMASCAAPVIHAPLGARERFKVPVIHEAVTMFDIVHLWLGDERLRSPQKAMAQNSNSVESYDSSMPRTKNLVA